MMTPTIIDYIAARVAENPERTAIGFRGGAMAYGAVWEASEMLGQHLVASGLTEQAVVVALPAGPRRIITLLGALRAGCIVVPTAAGSTLAMRRFRRRTAAAASLWLQAGEEEQLDGLSEALRLTDDSGRTRDLSRKRGRLPAVRAQDRAYMFTTSGTAGRAKLVLGYHSGLAHFLHWQRTEFGVGADDVCAHLTHPNFDVVMRDVFLPLVAGGELLIPDPQDASPHRVLQWLISERATIGHFVPSLAQRWLAACDVNGRRSALRASFFAGEPLTASLVGRWREILRPGSRIINLYGPTETTLAKFAYEVPDPPQDGIQPVGTPLPETQVVILDDSLRAVQDGQWGEVGIITPYRATVSRWDDGPRQSGLDESRASAAKPYRTGDVGRLLTGGVLEVQGRLDDVVKILGVRVSPTAVMGVLESHPAVQQAAVIAVSLAEVQRLVALVVAPEAAARTQELRAVIAQALGESAVPHRFVFVDELPVGRNGKVDRTDLVRIAETDDEAAGPDRCEATLRDDGRGAMREHGRRQRLRAILADALNVRELAEDADFFELGGDSLAAVTVASRVRSELSTSLDAAAVFAHPTLEALGAHLERQTEPIRQRYPAPGTIHRDSSSCSPGASGLSFEQRRMLLLAEISTPGTYHIGVCWRLRGVLEIAWLKAAIAEVADRHPVLRARFEKDEQGAWVEMRCDASRPVLEHMRLEPGSEDDGMRELESQLSRVAGRPLPIDRGPSARLVIVRTPNERCTLLVAAFHHAIFDDRSVTLFARDLAAAYNAALGDRPAVRRSPAASYASYVDWQRARPLSDESADLDYWQTVLAGLPRTGLLADRAARASAENGVWRRSLGASQADNLRRQAARLQATPFIIIAAAFAVTLARFADDRDVAFALPVSTRPGREYAETMGVFVNTVIIRIRVDPLARFRDVVSDMRRAVADALEHRHAPFQRVVQRLRPERDGTDNPLVDVSLALDDASQTPLTLRGAPGEPLRCAPGATKYRISATTVASRGVIELAVDYRAVEYGNATIVSFGTCWFNVLIAGAEQVEVPVGQASPISGDCHQALMANRKRTTHQEVKTNTLAAGFERVAATYGGSVAIDDGIAALTYAELDKQSRVICSELECAGHRPSTAVVFMAPRSAQALVWLLGATRAGLTCVPVERDLRADQLARVVRETQASAIATAAAWQQTEVAVPTVVIDRDITGERNGAPSKRGPAPETAAYILYTSGSTGPAKAVMTTHSVAVRHMTVARTLFDVGPTDRVLQFADFSFDAAIEQIWTTWLAGATLCVRRNETWTAADFFRRCTEFGVTVAGLPTSYWGHLVSQGLDDASVPTLRRVVVGGEAMRADLAARWLSKHPTTKLVNAYGPTEAAITATWFEASPTACHEAARPHLPIGRALPGRIPYILDDSGAPVPPGAVGELYLGGDLLAAGYLGLGTGSTHGFLADPFAGGGARMFRTRDVVRAGPDGVLEYLGRKDRQVKLLGRRLEPAQVEAAMEASSGVMEAVVLPSVDHGTVTGLTGYYTAPNGRSATSSATLRDELGVLLPKWMVPRTLNPVDRIPRTAGGKVDTAALPSVTRQTAAAPTEPRPQSLTAAEEVVLDAWRSVLGSTEIGIYDNFFALGGHSLLAASITAHIGRATGVDLPLRAMFEAPTVVSLGERLEDALLAEDATVDSSRGDATPSPDGMP